MGKQDQVNRVPASERLTRALVDLAAAGGRPPCGDFGSHEMWTSEDVGERLVAVALCGGCPIIEVCGEAGEEGGEAYVWGGCDYGVRPRPARERAA